MILRRQIEERAVYLRDFVFSANDGLITTFAIVAGAQGAQLTSNVVIILGVANLLADGISMASGDYLALESELEYKERNKKTFKFHPELIKHAGVVFVSFVLSGVIPLIPFIFDSEYKFMQSIALMILALMGLGVMRSLAAQKGYIRSVLETSIVGTSAAVLAFGIGRLLENLIR